MSTASLLRWIALVAGAELAVRGHLANHVSICHAGAALFALALAAFAWPTWARRAGAVAAAAVVAIAAIAAAVAWLAAPAWSPAASPPERGAPAEAAPRATAIPAPGATAILVFAGRGADGQAALSPVSLGVALHDRLHCNPPVEAFAPTDLRGTLGDPPALGAA